MPSNPEQISAWTAQDLADYHAGRLHPDRAQALERDAARDAFLQSAVDGNARLSNGATERVQQRVSQKTTSRVRGWSIVLGLVGMAVCAWLIWPTSPDDFATASPVDQSLQAPAIVALPLEAQAVIEEETSIKNPIVHSERTDSSVGVTVRVETPQALPEPNEPQQYAEVRLLPEKELREIEPALIPLESPEPKPVGQVGATVYEVARYRVVDYRGLRASPMQALQQNWGGLSPAYSNPYDQTQASAAENNAAVEVSYVLHLEKAIGHYAAGRYRRSQLYFRDILNEYPDDVNALFYGGMADYHLGKDASAMERLALVEDHLIRTFQEPAAFYLGLLELRGGKMESAKERFRRIVDQGGFYAERARAVLAAD